MLEFDFYKRLASRLYNKPENEITFEERKVAKLAFLQTMYDSVEYNNTMTRVIIPMILNSEVFSKEHMEYV